MKGQLIFCVISFAFLFRIAACREVHRIINGLEAAEKQIPYQVYYHGLKYFSWQFYLCGGTLISKRIVLTAAHCLDRMLFLQIRFGAVEKGDENDKKQLTVRWPNFVIHKQFDPIRYFNDIGLIKLPIELTFNEYIQPAKLPSPIATYNEKGAIVSGWGKDENGNSGLRLKYYNVNIISNKECESTMMWYGIMIPSSAICIGPSKSSPSQGDSGGPLVVKNGSDFVVLGITAFGLKDCQVNYPTVYTRVTSFLDWIHKNAGEQNLK